MKRVLAMIAVVVCFFALNASSAGAQYAELDGPVTLDQSTFVPGAPVTVTGSGYDPFSTGTIIVESDPVTIGSFTADANGAFSVSVNLPAGLAPGAHTIKTVGVDPNGDLLVLGSAITVSDAAAPSASPSTAPSLPATGTAIALFALVGLGSIAAGAVLIRARAEHA